MPFRDDAVSLEARREALAVQLEDVRHGRGEGDAAQLKAELAAMPRPKIDVLPPLGLLSRLRIASPCEEPWNAMVGDERVRRCTRCERDVYNLSGFTAAAAEALLAQPGEAPCVQFYRRRDGTIMTSDCIEASHRKLALKVLAVSACAIAAGAALAHSQPSEVSYSYTPRPEQHVHMPGFDPSSEVVRGRSR
jgi:hypothetical protein